MKQATESGSGNESGSDVLATGCYVTSHRCGFKFVKFLDWLLLKRLATGTLPDRNVAYTGTVPINF